MSFVDARYAMKNGGHHVKFRAIAMYRDLKKYANEPYSVFFLTMYQFVTVIAQQAIWLSPVFAIWLSPGFKKTSAVFN